MPLRLRSAGGGSVLLKPPVALTADVSMEVPGYEGAKLLTDKTPGAVIQVQSVTDGTAFTISAAVGQVYYTLGTALTLTSKVANSKFLIIGAAPYYCDGVLPGIGLGLKVNGVLVIGTDGSSGDSWTMGGNSDPAARSGNLTRVHQHAPNLPAGSVLTFALAGARWAASGGNVYFNYAGYNTKSNITVMEIAA